MATFRVRTYSVRLGLGPLPGGVTAVAGIRCAGEVGGDFLDIAFVDAGVLPPNASNVDGNARWHVSYRPVAELPCYLDLLRNEKPIEMHMDAAQPQRHAISTGREPVGELEA